MKTVAGGELRHAGMSERALLLVEFLVVIVKSNAFPWKHWYLRKFN